MRIASLDLGSNSFLCLIVDINEFGIASVICDEVRVVRLSEGVQKTGLLSSAALDRAKEALSIFKKIIVQNQVDKVLAVTTAVARQASNSKLFLDMVSEFQIPIQIISGADEAEITYLGAVSGLEDQKDLLVIDVGGGSTEIIYNISYAQSFNFGVVRLKEKFDVQFPISEKARTSIAEYIDLEMNDFLLKIKNKNIESAIAVAGTPTTLAAIEIGRYDAQLADGYTLSLERLEFWYSKLSQMKPEEILNTYYIEAGRTDVIAIGTLILIRILQILKLKEIKVSVRGIRYGILLKEIKMKFK
jgi:exopolyphosphatase/guanosine-5'-triphosphate,3'-diphosphate pyrophosphatase